MCSMMTSIRKAQSSDSPLQANGQCALVLKQELRRREFAGQTHAVDRLQQAGAGVPMDLDRAPDDPLGECCVCVQQSH